MKLKFLIAPTLLGAVTIQANAQEVSQECLQNISLMGTYAKQAAKGDGNYSEAVAPFEYAYQNCPTAHKSIYTYGINIVRWQFTQAKDAATKTKLLDKMMKLYDERTQLFSSSKQPSYYIQGRKAFDYINLADETNYKTSDPLKKNAYDWMKKALEEGGENNELDVFKQYYLLSRGMFQAKKSDSNIRQQYVNDYLMLSDLLGKRVAENVPEDSLYDQFKGNLDYDFGESGAADCNQLNSVYASQIDAHKADKDYLNQVLALYDMADCEGSTVYFKASKYMYDIEPSYKAANGLAAQAYSKGDMNGAITYYNKACDLATSKSDKSNIMLKIASIYYKKGNFANVRTYAQKALAYNGSNGSAYMLIGNAYVSGAKSISSDPFIQRTAYWAAVDKFERAKAVDGNCAARANSAIARFKQYFPDKKECFMRKISGTYHVPGWINENTKVR